MTARTYQVLTAPDMSSDSLIEKGATLGNGQSMADFMREFDGSELGHEFSLPPEPEEFYGGADAMELSEAQAVVLAKAVRDGFRAGRVHSHLWWIAFMRDVLGEAAGARSSDDYHRIMERVRAELAALEDPDNEQNGESP